jgi:hypothetical protein
MSTGFRKRTMEAGYGRSEEYFLAFFSNPDKDSDQAYTALPCIALSPLATPSHKGSGFVIQLVLNTAIFCAEMATDCQTGREIQESQDIDVRFSRISAGKPSGYGNRRSLQRDQRVSIRIAFPDMESGPGLKVRKSFLNLTLSCYSSP